MNSFTFFLVQVRPIFHQKSIQIHYSPEYYLDNIIFSEMAIHQKMGEDIMDQ